MPSHIQPQNRNRIFRIYSKPKKSCLLYSFMYIVSAKLKKYFVASDALQQSKSGPSPKKVGNHWFTLLRALLGHEGAVKHTTRHKSYCYVCWVMVTEL